MRRRPSTPSVTLFPFLAVLVCTMGALIFLLLVITQKIQKQSQLPLVSISQPTLPKENPQSLEVIEFDSFVPLLEPDIEDPPITVQHTFDEEEPILPFIASNSFEDHQWLQTEWNERQRKLRESHARKLEANVEEQRRLDQKMKTQSSHLQLEIAAQQQRKKQLVEQLDKSQRELDLMDRKRESLTTSLELTDQQLAEAKILHQQEKEKRFLLQAQAADLTRQIARLEEQNDSAITETEIVAYDSITGTARKPILLECRGSEIVFASEGVVLSAQDLSGFPPEYNPLKAGAEALLEYWKTHGQSHERPYLLLVVRPEGTTGFYVARGLLSELDHRFGYELVETDLPIRWPENDVQAMKVCQDAVFSVLKERDRVASRLGRLSTVQDGPLSYATQDGRFQLPSSSPSGRNQTENFIGDEKWVSPNRRGASSSPAPSSIRKPPVQVPDPIPKSILRPVPSESAQPLFENETSAPRVINIPTQIESDRPSFDSEKFRNSQSPSNSQSNERSSIRSSQRKHKSSGSPESLLNNPIDPFQPKPSPAEQEQIADGIRISRPQRSGVIGIERETEIHLWENRFQIDDGTKLNIPIGTRSVDLKAAMTAAIGKATAEWDSPPKSYFWKPIIKIVVHPGGMLHFAQAKELADSWKIPTRVEYEIE